MKKTLLIAAAALAASVISSQAQVYSQNIVGYVNKSAGANFSIHTAPFDAAGGNSLTNLIQNPGGVYDGSQVFIWGSTSYNIYTLDSGFATGVGDANDANAVTAPVINPGTAFLFNNGGVSNTITYAGTVHVGSGSIPGTSTNVIPNQALNLISPVIPFGGGITSSLGFTNVAGALDGNQIFIPIISPSGVLSGFNTVTFDSGFASGFGDANDAAQVAEPQIPVGSGFFFGNGTGGTVKWIQSL